MKPCNTAVVLWLFTVACISSASLTPRLNNPFFVFDDGLGGGAPVQEAQLAREVGFDGISFDGAKLVAERLKALDERGLQFFFLYVGANVSDGEIVYEPGIEDSIRALKGRSTIVWLTIRGGGPGAEQRAVEATRKICDLAARENLRVALYPHYGMYVARLSDAMRVADEAKRSNLGVTFNLCHELRSGFDPDVRTLLERALPRLYAVSINGADQQGDWDQLIQPLDRGAFDVAGFVRTLIQVGYNGPIGLQCYAIKGDARTNLEHSMQAWRNMAMQFAQSFTKK
jgi:sugar phosphate isomerase/epimerase